VIHQAGARYLDGVDPRPRVGRLVFDEAHRELHFYEEAETGDRFICSIDKNQSIDIRSRGGEQVIEWRPKTNHTSSMLILNDLPFTRLIRDRFLAHKNVFWRYATLVWSESLGKVALALVAAVLVTGLATWYFMEHSFKLIPVAWDKKVGDQAAPGLKEFGDICESKQTVADFKRVLPYLTEKGTPHQFDIQILKSPVENAFALPGGKITFFAQTIKKAKTNAELVGILAHEVGHVERRHGMQQLSQYMTLRVILALAFGMADETTTLAMAADAGAILFLLKNSRDHERDADAYAAEKLAAAGISSRGIRSFFERIGQEHKKEMSKVPDFILTHPADEDRIRFFERYEKKHAAKMKKANERLPDSIKAWLRSKPQLSAACIPPEKESAKDVEEEDSDE
jgi:Zn-dependent protease with chaperone function